MNIQQTLNEVRDGLKRIADHIEKTEDIDFPMYGDTIFRFNSQGMIIEELWTATRKQQNCSDFTGVYRTKEEAALARAGIMTFVSEM